MKPKLKIYLKPKYKIGSMAWTLNFGFSIADYFQNPTDDKLLAREVVGYSINYKNGKAKITSYHYKDGGSDTGRHDWDFISKKAIKEFLKQKAIYDYRYSSGRKPEIQKFNLTAEEKKLLKISNYEK